MDTLQDAIPRRWLVALAGGVLLLSLALYFASLAPTITWRFSGSDSGELASAAYTWGVPHPTGYPLWTLLGFLITRLPFGDPAFRTNVLSAICGAAAAALVALAVVRLGDGLAVRVAPALRLIAAAGAGLALATAPAFWSQAILTEVYSLNALLIALIVWLLAGRSPLQPQGRLALASGLALTNHSTAIFVITAAALAAFLRGRPRRLEVGALLRAGVLFLLPLSLYLLIPWRAAQHPAENWNDPQTLGRFLQLVTGAQYHYLLAWNDPIGSIKALPAIVRLFLGQFAWWGLPLALYGLLLVAEVDVPFAVFAVLSVLAYAGFTAVYRAEGAEYYLPPAYLIEAVLIGVGLVGLGAELTAWARRQQLAPRVASGLLALIVALSVIPFAAYHFPNQDLRHDFTAYDSALTTLAAAPQGATLFTNRDEDTFALWYLQKVKGYRRDVRVVDTRLAHQ